MIAGSNSGAGKTTVSLALMRALARRGVAVQPFKVGPDFIDPGHHALAAGRPSHNLDGWMLSPQYNQDLFRRHAGSAQVAVVEGVMGLYDGLGPRSEVGSTAQMAKLLDLPVLLVVNAQAMARSLAALVQGFVGFDPGLSWAGVVANKVGSPAHAALLAEAMELVPQAPFLGGLPRRPELALAERHLGLVMAGEGGLDPDRLDRLAAWLEQGLDLDGLLERLPEVELPPPGETPAEAAPLVRLGVARDQAFCFCYQENLRHLRAAGAELVFFSPLNDSRLPPGLDGLYLSGGYPELFAGELAGNQGLRSEIATLARAGLPIYAECGGMMYLGRELEDGEGRRWPMAGVLPLRTRMLPRLKSLGYREVTLARDTPLGPAGTVMRGHEFHYSEVGSCAPDDDLDAGVYQVSGRRGTAPDTRGYLKGAVLASYVHLHFGSNPRLAQNFVSFCRKGNLS